MFWIMYYLSYDVKGANRYKEQTPSLGTLAFAQEVTRANESKRRQQRRNSLDIFITIPSKLWLEIENLWLGSEFSWIMTWIVGESWLLATEPSQIHGHINELLVASNTRNPKRGGKRDLNGDDAAEVRDASFAKISLRKIISHATTSYY